MIKLYSVQVVTRMKLNMGVRGWGFKAGWQGRRSDFLSAEVQRATSSALSDPYGLMRASRKLPPNTSPRYWDQESSVP